MEVANTKLILFYSWSGNTHEVASKLQDILDATLFEIIPVEKYSTAYGACVERARKEVFAKTRPLLTCQLCKTDFAKYHTVFIGSPNWCNTIAPPVSTFLYDNVWNGKRVVPFIIHGGGGISGMNKVVADLCSGAELLPTLDIYGRVGSDLDSVLRSWLTGIGIK